jgi:hypothetical protein
MATKKKRNVKVWTQIEEKLFKQLAKSGIPTTKIAKQLKRTAASIRSKAQKYGVSLGGGRTAKKSTGRKSSKR